MTDGGKISDGRFSFRCTDPARFGRHLIPVAPDVSAENTKNGSFAVDVQAVTLPNLGLFTVRIEDARVLRAPSDYIAVTVPLDQDLRFFDGHCTEAFSPGTAHVLWNDHRLDLHIPQASTLLVATYPMGWLRKVWTRPQLKSLDQVSSRGDEAMFLDEPEGRTYWRHLNFIWSEVCRSASFLTSDVAAQEIEKSNATLFLLAILGGAIQPAGETVKPKPDVCLEGAERYIREHLDEPFSLGDLVAASECSASTLLRAFRLHRGTTPIRFAKQLRLEAVQRALLAGDPKTTTISEIATEFGFFQLGRFSAEYKRAFGEYPSQTLRY